MPNPRKAADRERKQRKRKHGMRVSGASLKKWERIEVPLWALCFAQWRTVDRVKRGKVD